MIKIEDGDISIQNSAGASSNFNRRDRFDVQILYHDDLDTSPPVSFFIDIPQSWWIELPNAMPIFEVSGVIYFVDFDNIDQEADGINCSIGHIEDDKIFICDATYDYEQGEIAIDKIFNEPLYYVCQDQFEEVVRREL